MFVPAETAKQRPFVLNCHVYSCSLILNSLPNEWRGQYNEDTDYCLQVLADGWCTVLLNAFMVDKMPTMTMTGGNTEELYQYSDGRLKMSRSLERKWPGVVTTKRRFQRPQHVVRNAWKDFDTQLIPVGEIDRTPDNYGLELKAVRPVRSESLRKLIDGQ
ncbi:MAG: hypothetical protein GY906_10240 [bacterium]|nr:hypothetical protein [bacterium]